MAFTFVLDGEHQPEKRCCHDCANLIGYVTLWCAERDKTKLGHKELRVDCEYWKPMEKVRVWHHLNPFVMVVKPIITNQKGGKQ